jgi:hypothetical protein
VTLTDMESLEVAIVLGLGAILLVAITVRAIIALRKGQPFGKTLKAWARDLVVIIAGL